MLPALVLALLAQVQPGPTPAPTPAPPAAEQDFTPFPEWHLFQPILADPRDPHFGAVYRYYLTDNGVVRHAAAVSFGEMFGLAGWSLGDLGRLEFGVHAGVFAVFDLAAESFDLINADYLLGFPLAWSRGDWALQLRIFHQSSHLGDEFLLRGPVDRVNLSYEVVDFKASYQWKDFRAVAGIGSMVHSDPSDIDPLLLQLGGEWEPGTDWFGGAAHPVFAVDFQWTQESNFGLDLSAKAGILLHNPIRGRRRIRLMTEYYRGRSPDGQFYDERSSTVGVGIHVYF